MMAEVDGGAVSPNRASCTPPPTSNQRLDASADAPDTARSDLLPEAPLSKNQQKKLKRHQEWEEGRDARKARRKEKNKERKARKRENYHAAINHSQLSVDGVPTLASAHIYSDWKEKKKHYRALQLPLAFIFDCDFDDLMTDTERISLASQLTRAYSDNRKARYRAHMLVSSFGGKLKERFEGVLGRHHEQWKGVTFTDADFLRAAKLAQTLMQESEPKIAPTTDGDKRVSDPEHFYKAGSSATMSYHSGGASFGSDEVGEVVYLTSDSPYTLTHLKPFSTYIIGGLVDKNRHKGICYKRACDRDVKTAKLPIGDYMRLSSRQVLTTNHVSEIMLKWLDCAGDWGRAFDGAIPKRKGGILRESPAGCADESPDQDHSTGQVGSDIDYIGNRTEAPEEGETDGSRADGVVLTNPDENDLTTF